MSIAEQQKSIKITKEDSGSRLDKFLVKNFPACARPEPAASFAEVASATKAESAWQRPAYSRSFWQKRIEEGLVLVNGAKAAVHRFLKENDELNLNWDKIAALEKSKEIDLQPTDKIKLEIVFEDENFLVINKPAGLTVHPSETQKKDTLVNALIAYYPSIKEVGEDKIRPGIVHRLDRNASGLMVIAKTQAAFEHLKNQFKNRLVEKEYIVLVKGNVKQESGTIDLPIGRGKDIPIKMTVRTDDKACPASSKKSMAVARPALTEYEAMEYYDNSHTLLKIKIKTGRTHQIRVHFEALGYPVVGDKIYKPRKLKLSREETKLDRLFLHAARLRFDDLQNNRKEFKIELPEELKIFLATVKKEEK